MTTASARLLVGRTIVGFELRSWANVDGEGKHLNTAHDPIFILDNGARVTFTVQETEAGVYGVRPDYHPKERK